MRHSSHMNTGLHFRRRGLNVAAGWGHSLSRIMARTSMYATLGLVDIATSDIYHDNQHHFHIMLRRNRIDAPYPRAGR